MKRIIVDATRVTPDLLYQLTEEYPNGYTDSDVIIFTDHKNQQIKALEVKLKNDIYLVKVESSTPKIIDFYQEKTPNLKKIKIENHS